MVTILRFKRWGREQRRQPHQDLVKAGLDLLRWTYKTHGHFWPNSTRAAYNAKGEFWQKGSVYPGVGDILGCFHGRHIEFDAKLGKDKLSLDQREHRDQILRVSGFHYVFHDTKELETAMAEIEARIAGIGGG